VSGLALGSGIYVASRRDAVTARNVNDLPPPPTATSPSDQDRRVIHAH
jgi:hypothetical protein